MLGLLLFFWLALRMTVYILYMVITTIIRLLSTPAGLISGVVLLGIALLISVIGNAVKDQDTQRQLQKQMDISATQTAVAANPCLYPLSAAIGGKLYSGMTWDSTIRSALTDGELYSQPTSNSRHIITMSGLDDADIIEGPVCEHGNVWWKVSYIENHAFPDTSTFVGWAKEDRTADQ